MASFSNGRRTTGVSPLAIPYVVVGGFIVIAALYDVAFNVAQLLN